MNLADELREKAKQKTIENQKVRESFARLCPGDFEENLRIANSINWQQIGKDSEEGREATMAAFNLLRFGSLSEEEVRK